MRFRVRRSDVDTGLRMVSGVPSADGILFAAVGDHLYLATRSQAIDFCVRVACEVIEPGGWQVPSGAARVIVQAPVDEIEGLVEDGTRLCLSADGWRVRFPCDEWSYGLIRRPGEFDGGVDLSAVDLARVLRQVVHAASPDRGVHLSVSPGDLTVQATDGVSAGRASTPAITERLFAALIPADSARALVRWCGGGDVGLGKADGQLWVWSGEWLACLREESVKFPDLDHIFAPRTGETRYALNKRVLLSALDTVGLFSNRVIRLAMEDGLVISARGVDHSGRAVIDNVVRLSGREWNDILLDPARLRAGVANVGDKVVQLGNAGSDKALMISGEHSGAYQCRVMAMVTRSTA